MHWVITNELVLDPNLDLIPDPKLPVNPWPIRCRRESTIFQRMLACVVIRFISTMSSSHSIPSGSWLASAWSCPYIVLCGLANEL